MLDDGILTIYKKVQKKSVTGGNIEKLELYSKAWYGELSFGVSEYYTAKQAQSKVEKRVRLHQDRTLCNKHVVVLNDTQYEVGRVFNGVEKGIQITDITLERVTTQYDIA